MSRIVNLSESVLIALHSLILLMKQHPKPVSTKSIAGATGASENTISKVMQRLVKDNFIESTRGPAGGFILLKTPDKISFMDIFESIEGKLETSGCPFNSNHCTFGTCIFDNYLNKISAEVKEFFIHKTLAEYVE
jgi:Rrf2 family transcriptional regulator, nitric oxide-sensitive transcriptional repressor